MILLHGLGSDSSEWSRVSSKLASRSRLIMPDQIGFGQSDKPNLRYRTGTLVSFLEGFCDALRIERTSLIAHGVSGNAAAAFAAMHPERIDRLILVSTGFLLQSAGIELLNPATREESRELTRRIRHESNAFAADEVWAEFMISSYANQALIDSALRGDDPVGELLTGLRPPALVVWGREDSFTPIGTGERIHVAIPHSQLSIVEGCGHSPQREQPASFAEIVNEFLTGSEAHQKISKPRQEENVWF
ncbi:MAG: alpha/beta hydrolase [Acidobacteriota bacterium]|nr:alpha/beta hydrolase [Acidobacteriota bacterium]